LVEYRDGHLAACHHPLNVTPAMVAHASAEGARVQEPAGSSDPVGVNPRRHRDMPEPAHERLEPPTGV
jgi:hypothetical protein